MTETGRIREIRGNLIIIAPEKGAACFGCTNQECRAGGGIITAENISALPLETGQEVEVEVQGAALLGQSLAALLPPALSFAVGYVLGRLLFPESGEGAAAGVGVIFLFAAAFIVYLIRKRKPAGMAYSVTKIIG